MPELPEVETTRRGVEPHLLDRSIVGVVVRDGRLRWPVPGDLPGLLTGRRIAAVRRRAKYLLFDCGGGHLIVHLGMTGSLRLLEAGVPPAPHDHVDIVLDDGRALRFRDPRRFGAILWTARPPGEHVLLQGLGPEPLDGAFDGGYLHGLSRGRTPPVKAFIMDGRVVVGVGNIYANEALFAAGIRPQRAAGQISALRYQRLAVAIKAANAARARYFRSGQLVDVDDAGDALDGGAQRAPGGVGLRSSNAPGEGKVRCSAGRRFLRSGPVSCGE